MKVKHGKKVFLFLFKSILGNNELLLFNINEFLQSISRFSICVRELELINSDDLVSSLQLKFNFDMYLSYLEESSLDYYFDLLDTTNYEEYKAEFSEKLTKLLLAENKSDSVDGLFNFYKVYFCLNDMLLCKSKVWVKIKGTSSWKLLDQMGVEDWLYCKRDSISSFMLKAFPGQFSNKNLNQLQHEHLAELLRNKNLDNELCAFKFNYEIIEPEDYYYNMRARHREKKEKYLVNNTSNINYIENRNNINYIENRVKRSNERAHVLYFNELLEKLLVSPKLKNNVQVRIISWSRERISARYLFIFF